MSLLHQELTPLSLMPNNSDDRTKCLQAAIRLLSRREHSRKELASKLRSKDYFDNTYVDTILDELEASDYLNDQRFTQMFIRSRIARGQGPQKIQYELSKRGVDHALIEQSMQETNTDWILIAKQQREKRFGVESPKDYKEQAKQSRFLAGRGFFSDTIREIFNS